MIAALTRLLGNDLYSDDVRSNNINTVAKKSMLVIYAYTRNTSRGIYFHDSIKRLVTFTKPHKPSTLVSIFRSS
jgi:hypothetical protein